jgi:protein involved in polysaccharide export with SLBB domain
MFLNMKSPVFPLLWRGSVLTFALTLLCGFTTHSLAQSSIQDTTVAVPAAADSGEVLKVNDLVKFTVYKEDDMTTEARISKSGEVVLPLLGSVHIAGKTIGEAAEDLRERLDKDYIINPQVTLTVMEYAPQWVTVLGEVQHPSQVNIPPEGGLDLVGAIALAGGYSRVADPANITVRRVVNGRDVVLRVDAKKLAGDSRVSTFMVQPGDTISVGESVW